MQRPRDKGTRHNKPEKIASVSGYVDSIEMSSSRAIRSELLGAIRPQCGTVFVQTIYDKIDKSTIRRHLLKVNQPTLRAIELLDEFMQKASHRVSVCRLHIALDFDQTRNATREEVIELIETAIHLRYRRDTDEQFEYGGTRYSTKVKGRKTRPSKQTAFYRDRVGKLDGECEKLHFEIRLEKKRTVKSAGIELPSDLLKLDIQSFVQKQLKIADHKPALRKIIEKSIAETNRQYPHPHVEIATRVRSLFKRMGTDTLTGFKRMFPIRAERLKPLDVLDVSNQLHWIPRVTDCTKDGFSVDRKCGELSPLSPTTR